jgi:type IV pilus assembly protein PilB
MGTDIGYNLGKMLVDEKFIKAPQLAQALANMETQGGSLGFNLALLGACSEEEVARFIGNIHSAEYIDLSSAQVDLDSLGVISRDTANSYACLAVRKQGNSLVVAVVEPVAPELANLAKEVKFKTNMDCIWAVSPESYIRLAIDHYYGQLASMGLAPAASDKPGTAGQFQAGGQAPAAHEYNMKEIVQAAEGEMDLSILDEKKEEELGTESADDSIVIKMANAIITEAVVKKASDIHIEPFEKELIIRYRVDGTLVKQPAPPPSFKRALVARLKVMAKLNIMEKRKPQDGRIKIKVRDRMIDLRVASCPVMWGEKIVMRILDQQNLRTDLTELGFEPYDLDRFQKAIRTPYGIILVTGPTGSGKTTTLYSALSTVNDPKKNVMTAEDPVEFQLPGINQVPVNPEIGMTFAAALKSFLRCDPNIVMVGEIRDLETGDIAIKAAMTGQLVLSTLHTNDAPSTINRMVDMGIQPFYLGTTLVMIVAQRLVKRICSECKEEVSYDLKTLELAGIHPDELKGRKLYRGKGCTSCNSTGYKGRLAIYEVMPVSDTMRRAIFRNEETFKIREIAISEGMSTLRMSAVKKWFDGTTTLEEVMRVTLTE